MKRYLISIITTIFTVVVIGIFYIQSVLADGPLPKFSLEKVSGDESYAEDLVLYGDFNRENVYEDFRIVNNETIYRNQAPIVEKAMGIIDPKFESLIKEHRNFMRGKNYNHENYYEDENRLVYADIEWKWNQTYILELQVLEKDTNQTISFKKQLPNQENQGFPQVVEVQVNDSHQVQVIVQNYLYNQEESEEYRVYTFDIETQELIANDLITSIPMTENGWTDTRLINHYESLGKEKYLFIKRLSVEHTIAGYDEEGEIAGEPIVHVDDYVIYNLETKESEVLTIPEELYEQVTVNLEHIDQSTIYFSSISGNGVEIVPYDIESKTFGDLVGFALNGAQEIQSISFYKDRIYLIHSNLHAKSEKLLTIGSVDTGKVLYKGTVKDTSESETDQPYEISINNLSVYE